MNLTAPAAVAAFETAFPGMLREGPGSFGAFESGARSVALASCAEAMPRALEARDRELAASRPKGLRVHSRRPRALATMCGDVRFRRTVLVDGAGLARYPLDEELDLPAGDRVSPSARSFLVTCGADVPFARTAELMAIAGGSPVSATTVMDSVRSAGEAIAGIGRGPCARPVPRRVGARGRLGGRGGARGGRRHVGAHARRVDGRGEGRGGLRRQGGRAQGRARC